MSIYRKDGSATHPRPLTVTEERIIQVMRSAAASGAYLIHREHLRQAVANRFPGTGGIFGALEDMERDKIVASDANGFYHLVGVIYA